MFGKDTTQVAMKDDMFSILQDENTGVNWWMVIAVVELLVIVALLFQQGKAKRKETWKNNNEYLDFDNAKSQNVDMSNLMNSISSSRDTYKALIKKCHPDRFQDEVIKAKAEELSQEISANKRNYAKLMELKEVAIKELNVKF